MSSESTSIASGTHLLHATATFTGLLAIAAILLELFTERWLAEAIGWPTFLSLPLGIGTVVFVGLTAKTALKVWPFVVMAILYWSIFAWGSFGA